MKAFKCLGARDQKKTLKENMLAPQDPVLQKCLRLLIRNGKKAKACQLLAKTLRRLDTRFSKTQEITSCQSQDEHSINSIWGQPLSLQGEALPIKLTDQVVARLRQAIQNVKPFFELKKIRLSGTTHQVPALLPVSRQETLALRWLIQTARIKHKKASKSRGRSRQPRPLDLFLAGEIQYASQKQGDVRQRRDEVHKLAEANRGFYRYRWWG